MIRYARLFWISWLFNVKQLTRSGLFVFTSVIEPLIMATLAYYLFQAGRQPGSLLYSALAAGLMGVWTSTLFGSGGVVSWQRWQGTLESVVVSPPPFISVLFPLTVATASIGFYSLAATLLWGRLVFGIPLEFEHPFLFALALPVTTIGLGLLGLVMASTFVLYRHASAFSNLLEYPVWLVSGLLVPIALLPGWAEPISWLLAPTWGVRAVRDAALGGDPLAEIGMCVALSAAYLAIGTVTMANFERLARSRATLSLI